MRAWYIFGPEYHGTPQSPRFGLDSVVAIIGTTTRLPLSDNLEPIFRDGILLRYRERRKKRKKENNIMMINIATLPG
jgi:hypothetical protein